MEWQRVGKTKGLIFLLLISCEDITNYNNAQKQRQYLDIMLQDFTYNTSKSHTYHSLTYNTTPRTRVFWTSTDSFTVYFQNTYITQPIINYSTYSRDDGSGKQMIYIDRTMIGKTLQVIGCLDRDYCISKDFRVVR